MIMVPTHLAGISGSSSIHVCQQLHEVQQPRQLQLLPAVLHSSGTLAALAPLPLAGGCCGFGLCLQGVVCFCGTCHSVGGIGCSALQASHA